MQLVKKIRVDTQTLWIAGPIVFSLFAGTILSIARPSFTKRADIEFNSVKLAEMGHTNFKLGEYSEALKNYQKAISIAPKLAQAYVGRAAVNWEKGNRQAALTDYQKAVSLYQEQKRDYEADNVREVLTALNQGKEPACIPGNPRKTLCLYKEMLY